MWRPKTWGNPPMFVLKAKPTEAYEAGADAMLRAILPPIEQEIKAHTSQVSFEAIVGSTFWESLKGV